MANKLTEKQRLFVKEYLVDLNATKAATRAGYSEKTAMEQGYQLLQKTSVREAIDIEMKEREKRTEISADRVLQELAHIAFDDIKNYLRFYTDSEGKIQMEVKDSEKIDTRSIAEVSLSPKDGFKFKMYCKDNALVNLGKHLGLFKDNSNINVKLGVTIIDDIEDDEDEA